jgi:hypothetical protein
MHLINTKIRPKVIFLSYLFGVLVIKKLKNNVKWDINDTNWA